MTVGLGCAAQMNTTTAPPTTAASADSVHASTVDEGIRPTAPPKFRYGSLLALGDEPADEPVFWLPLEVKLDPFGPIGRVESSKAHDEPEQRHLAAMGSQKGVSQLLGMRVRTVLSLFFCGGLGC